MMVMGGGPGDPVGGSVMSGGDVVGVVSVGGGVESGAVVGGTVVGGGGGGELVMVSTHGPLRFEQWMNRLDMPTGKVMSTVLASKPLSATVRRLSAFTRRPPWGTLGSALSR